MDLGIAGKTALVFGGSRGMGRACATQLSAQNVLFEFGLQACAEWASRTMNQLVAATLRIMNSPTFLARAVDTGQS